MAQVILFEECNLKVPDGNGGYTWKTFREDELHRPLINMSSANLPDPQAGSNVVFVGNDPHPRKGRLLSEIEINYDYTYFSGLSQMDLKVPKFIELIADIGNYSSCIFGWIDSVEPIATKGPKQNTLIKWHVDYWFTLQYLEWHAANTPQFWKSRGFALGAGRFRRGPEGMARPDPSAPRLWQYHNDTILVRDNNGTPDRQNSPYVIVLYTKTDNIDGNTYTHLQIAFWGHSTVPSGAQRKPSDADVYAGKLEEIMGIAPSSIVGVWYSPVQPNYTVAVTTHTYNNVVYGWYEYDPGLVAPQSYTITISNTPVCTNDSHKYLIVDPMGTVYATLPWGLLFDRVIMYVDIGTSGAWLNLKFQNGTGTTDTGEGRRIQIPLISAPVTSNVKSDYILSGQEEYDRTMARIQQEQNMLSGIAGTGTSVIGGAIGGSMVAPGLGTAVGAIGGAVSGLIGTGVNYWLQGEADRKSREAYDRLMSNQIANVIITAGGIAWIYHSEYRWKLVDLVRDPLSKGVLETEQEEFGYITDVYTTGAQTAVASGGGFRIEGLEVKGDISPEARRYVASMFDRGVHLDIIY